MTTVVPALPESPTADADHRSVVWFVNSLGYGSDLLYWGDILPKYIDAFPNSCFFTTVDGDKPISGTTKSIRHVPSWLIQLGRRQDSYDRKASIVWPWSLGGIRRLQPEVVVISEFTMPSVYVVLARGWLKSRVLLLVESDPLRGNPRRIGTWHGRLRRFVARRADVVLTNNQAGQQYLENVLNVPNSKIIRQPYVVSKGLAVTPVSKQVTAALRAQSGGHGQVVFLYVGQLIERKGISQLLDAVATLDKEHREKIGMWLVGDGAQRETIQRRVHCEGLADCIRVVGAVPYETIAAYYQSADVFVMPTLDDYRALVGFEAIGFGLPLLHSIYDGAAGEVVREGENGWTIDPRDRAGFADKIKWFVEHSEEIETMGAVSRRIAADFDVDVAVDSLITATKRCLAM